MDELLDILDASGNFTGTTALKSVAHGEGLFHQTAHIWFYTKGGQLLLQQRGRNKNTHPLLWDVSVAGHIGAGEVVEKAALREIEEEIGIVIPEDDLRKIGVFKSVQKHRNGITDCEFHHTFLAELKLPLASIRPQESEVERLELVPLDAFFSDVLEGKNMEKYVPHSLEYYNLIYREIDKLIS